MTKNGQPHRVPLSRQAVSLLSKIGLGQPDALIFATSGAEELQKKAPGAKVVKAFNTAFAHAMNGGRIGGDQLAGLVAGDDADAKAAVLSLAKDLGFDPIDAGPLASARQLEPLALLNIKLGFVQGYGPNSGFRFVH